MVNDDKESEAQRDFSQRQFAPPTGVQPSSEEHLRQLAFQCMHDGFSIVDASGVHIDVNPAFCAMTGFSASELLGCGPEHSYWPPDDHENIRLLLAKAMRDEFAEIQLTFMRKGGERFQVVLNPFAIRDSNGTITSYATTVKDITQRLQMQSALQDSEQRYRGLFESAADAIVILRGEKIIDVNEQALKTFGVASMEQLTSRVSFDFFPPLQPNGQDSRKFSIEKLKAAQAGEPQFFAWHHVKLDGTPFDAEVSLSTFKQGEETFIQAIIRDITQRTRMQTTLQESEQRYRALFENGGDAIMILKGDQVVDCNEQALLLSGRSREDLLCNPTIAYLPPTQPNGQNSLAFFTEKVTASHSGNPQKFEWTDNTLDGETINTEVTLTTFMIDGEPYTQSVVRDITQRKQLEDALRDSEVRFRAVFENAGDAISILKDSKTVDCNKRLCDLYGIARDEILSANTGEFFPQSQPNGQDSRDYFQEKVNAARTGQPQIYEWHGRKSDGTAVITEINLATLVVGGETFEIASARDITQRKKLQLELVELNKSLESRVAQRTDELGRAYDELLQRNVQYRTLAKKLTAAEEEERKRIARLLHDNHQQLLVAAKFKAEMLASHLYGADVNAAGAQILEILDQALDVTRSLTMELAPPILYGAGFVAAMQWLAAWMEEHHHLQVLVTGSLPVTPLPVDVSSLLFRAVRELLFNVIKHSGVTQASVKIVAFDQGLRVTVSDEGGGFDVADALHATRSYGLFSIQEQLASLEGRLDISSAPQRGTVCTVTIPVANEEGHPDIPLAAHGTTVETPDPQPAVCSPIRILVADDHTLARDALVQILDLIDDFEVVGEAVDGLDAVEKAWAMQPDVVLMDATMPRLSGLDATRRITTEIPGIKVIGLSMNARADMEPQMLAAGAASYLQKLTPVDELFSAIRGVMNRDTTQAR